VIESLRPTTRRYDDAAMHDDAATHDAATPPRRRGDEYDPRSTPDGAPRAPLSIDSSPSCEITYGQELDH